MSKMVIYGSYFSEDDVLSIIEDHVKADLILKRANNSIDTYSLLLTKVENTKLICKQFREYDIDYELYFIGRQWDSIGRDETGDEFKKYVETRMKEMFGKEIHCRTLCFNVWF